MNPSVFWPGRQEDQLATTEATLSNDVIGTLKKSHYVWIRVIGSPALGGFRIGQKSRAQDAVRPGGDLRRFL